MPSDKVTEDVAASVSKLTIDPKKSNSKAADATAKTAQAKSSKKKKPKVLDSWEDDESSSEEEEGAADSPTTPGPSSKDNTAGTSAPPPTPVTPSYRQTATPSYGGPLAADWGSSGSRTTPSGGREAPSRRPEKTDAVARRMIAGALGMRMPKQTEEQKAYDRALRDAERKRKEEERQKRTEQEKTEATKNSAWDD